jgi:hypothetical protein
MPPKQDVKGKGKAKRQLGVDTRKGKAKVTFQGVSSTESSMTGSEGSESEDEEPDGAQPPPQPKIGWSRTYPAGTALLHFTLYFHSAPFLSLPMS